MMSEQRRVSGFGNPDRELMRRSEVFDLEQQLDAAHVKINEKDREYESCHNMAESIAKELEQVEHISEKRKEMCLKIARERNELRDDLRQAQKRIDELERKVLDWQGEYQKLARQSKNYEELVQSYFEENS
jgi:uncharacterized coiled-coil DUF342 family protein